MKLPLPDVTTWGDPPKKPTPQREGLIRRAARARVKATLAQREARFAASFLSEGERRLAAALEAEYLIRLNRVEECEI